MYQILIVISSDDLSCVSTQIVNFKFRDEAEQAIKNINDEKVYSFTKKVIRLYKYDF